MTREEIEEREKEQKYELSNYIKSQDMNEKFYEYLVCTLKEYKLTKDYHISYYAYFNKTDRNTLVIRFKSLKGTSNNGISFDSYMCGFIPKPFMFSLWKYCEGKHICKDYDLTEIREDDFPKYLGYIKDFYEIECARKKQYEQLSLF